MVRPVRGADPPPMGFESRVTLRVAVCAKTETKEIPDIRKTNTAKIYDHLYFFFIIIEDIF
jgi:hypothetical protein